MNEKTKRLEQDFKKLYEKSGEVSAMYYFFEGVNAALEQQREDLLVELQLTEHKDFKWKER